MLRFTSGKDVAPRDGRRFNALVGEVLAQSVDGSGAHIDALEIITAHWLGWALVELVGELPSCRRGDHALLEK